MRRRTVAFFSLGVVLGLILGALMIALSKAHLCVAMEPIQLY